MKASNVKREGGKLQYRGHEFPGFNKPVNAPAGDSHKKMVLAKKGEDVKLVKFGLRGMEDFTQHKDPKRRENYLARSGGIRNKQGQLTKDDPFSANHWARKVLW
ncbi:MAG: Aeromonas phage 4 [Actinomycetota bacterium]